MPDTQGVLTDNISDGYHTFGELYEHRNTLFAVLCSVLPQWSWKSMLHNDGTMFDGMFIAGMSTPFGQVTYHVPLDLWNLYRVRTLDIAPEYDGHTSDDVLDRLAELAEM